MRVVRDTTLEALTSGQYEVRCYDEPDEHGPVVSRRRIVNDLRLAESMIVTWLDGSPALWDILHGERGTFAEWERINKLPVGRAPKTGDSSTVERRAANSEASRFDSVRGSGARLDETEQA